MSEKLAPALSLEQLIGAAPEFRAALAVAAKAARNRLPILIVGEPGTGKETLARAIHAASLRAKGPLLTLDCKAIPANIIDSELFGHETGAFPGAFAAKTGKLVQADGGTLLLDEIGALPAETQELLDRVLATGEVRPVGFNGSHSVDVRVIATTSRPLPEDFHPGLAERIGATTVTLPPLRERSGDIPALARHLLSRLAEQTGMRALSIGNDALAVLMRYGWPGNVRQLAGVLFRAGAAMRRQLADRRAFPAHRDPVALLRPPAPISRRTSAKSRSDEALAGAPRRHALHRRRPFAPARRDRGGHHPPRHRPLSRPHDRSRAPARDRPLDPLPQARRTRHRHRRLSASKGRLSRPVELDAAEFHDMMASSSPKPAGHPAAAIGALHDIEIGRSIAFDQHRPSAVIATSQPTMILSEKARWARSVNC